MTQHQSTMERFGGVPSPWPAADSAVRLYVDHEAGTYHRIVASIDHSPPLMRRVLAKARSLGLTAIEANDVHVDSTEMYAEDGEFEILLEHIDDGEGADAQQ